MPKTLVLEATTCKKEREWNGFTMLASPTSFYSYLYLGENGTPYYAGKGAGKRAFQRGKRLCTPPGDNARIVIFPMDSEALAFESERALIELFGRKDLGTGILHNKTNGGEGMAGLSERFRRKMSEILKGNKHRLGHKHTEDTRQKLREAMRGNQNRLGHLPEEIRQKIKFDRSRGLL